MASTSGRYAVVTKGPLTGAIACSNSGGKFGAELKFAGYDLLIVHGRSPKPVYLHIVDDEVEIVDAAPVWGTSCWNTEEWLKAHHQDPLLKVASIGIAGENLVRYACVINDLHRAAGRSGVGAVMGSKQLKAIAVRGTTGVTVDDPKRFMSVVAQTKAKLWDDPGRRGLEKYGTNAMIDNMHSFGGLPTRNSRQVQFEGTAKINARAMRATGEDGHRNLVANKACFGCTIACGRIAKINPTHFTVINRKEYRHASGGLEYETAFAFGAECGIDDIDALTFANFIMNEQGMDPISFGGTLSAAMELYEMGVITDADTDGVPLEFGNAEALTIMAEKTGRFEGFGRILGLGSKRLAEKYGHPEVSITIKGQEIPGYDARALQGMGLGYATSPRGACHMKHDVFEEDMDDVSGNGKAKPCKDSQDRIAAVDSTGLVLVHHERVGARGVRGAGRRRLRRRVDRPAADRGRRAHLQPGTPVQPRGRIHAGGRHVAATLPSDPGPERHRRGQGQRAGQDAPCLLPGTWLDRRGRAHQRDAEPPAGVSGKARAIRCSNQV